MTATAAAKPLTPADFARQAGVSRETLARLEAYAALLGTWRERVNLVGRSTLDDLWRRHILDSAQLWPLIPETARTLTDLGSGAGFPGLVLAILAAGRRPLSVSLVESDSRKCAFLAEAIRVTGVSGVTVVWAKAHERPKKPIVPPADVVTARALAPLDRLLALAAPLLAPGGVVIAPKGRQAEQELTAAAEHWKMAVIRHASATDAESTIFEVRALSRVTDR